MLGKLLCRLLGHRLPLGLPMRREYLSKDGTEVRRVLGRPCSRCDRLVGCYGTISPVSKPS